MWLKNDKILFIGDSITSSGRETAYPESLGDGFPLLIASHLFTKYPSLNFSFYNRGVGGDTLYDLVERWGTDCLELNPDVVIIMIGVNDTWNNMSKGHSFTEKDVEDFETNYRYLLKSLYQRTDARVILMEPFILPYSKDRQKWRSDLNSKIEIVRKLARDYQTELIPLDGILNAKAVNNRSIYYTEEDGVHPTIAGHGEIAKSWLSIIKGASQK